MTIGSGLGAIAGAASGVANTASAIQKILGLGGPTYFQQLQPATFRAISFQVLGGDSEFGRRTHVHEYPYRDMPWVEDLGRKTRLFRLTGFLVGDDVIAQRKALIDACEVKGPGNLVHPTFGAKTVNLVDFKCTERWEKGRYFELTFTFVEGGPRVYPTGKTSTGAAIHNAAFQANSSAALDFASTVLSALKSGAATVGMAVSTALTWYDTAQSLVGDATSLFNIVCSLPGDFGRFFSGNLLGILQSTSPASGSAATIQSLVAQGAENRAAVAAAGATLNTAASNLQASTTAAFAAAAQGVAVSVLASCVNPADGLRLLGQLANFTPAVPTPNSLVGAAMSTMQGACGDLFRRAAVVALATASSSYQPTSYNDAVTIRETVTGFIDNEITIAGDEGDDSTYGALRALRQAVVTDLVARGANLAQVTTFTFGAPLPALYLANRIYQDPTRSDQLVAQANPVHPAFMPASFQALAS
jgi:prophage DNA circulation protein